MEYCDKISTEKGGIVMFTDEVLAQKNPTDAQLFALLEEVLERKPELQTIYDDILSKCQEEKNASFGKLADAAASICISYWIPLLEEKTEEEIGGTFRMWNRRYYVTIHQNEKNCDIERMVVEKNELDFSECESEQERQFAKMYFALIGVYAYWKDGKEEVREVSDWVYNLVKFVEIFLGLALTGGVVYEAYQLYQLVLNREIFASDASGAKLYLLLFFGFWFLYVTDSFLVRQYSIKSKVRYSVIFSVLGTVVVILYNNVLHFVGYAGILYSIKETENYFWILKEDLFYQGGFGIFRYLLVFLICLAITGGYTLVSWIGENDLQKEALFRIKKAIRKNK